ncbi:hypothetical protein BH09SUM1_BH09SUM1_19570 [soil metagenome]
MNRRDAIRLYLLISVTVSFFLIIASSGVTHCGSEIREKVARVRSDMRSLATALETYRYDESIYPPSLDRVTSPIAYINSSFPDPFKARRFGAGYLEFLWRSGLWTLLIVPVGMIVYLWRPGMKRRSRENFGIAAAMIAVPVLLGTFLSNDAGGAGSYPVPNTQWGPDQQGFRYGAERTDFFLQSVGPDGSFEPVDFSSMQAGDSINIELLILHSYDPTNGSASTGDLFRTRDWR